jgi:alpha-tubulin suppressor-like RCC1 family protein
MPLDDVLHVAAGWRHICAVRGDRSLVCLGGNESGALGVGGNLTIPRRTPAHVELDEVVDVSAGPGHTCALTTAGIVWCGGENDHGQLGNGKVEAGLSGSVNPIPGRVQW